MASRIDWERIEPDWRAGLKSVLQIAADYESDTSQKVSHTAINKHFRKLGVPRDLKAKVQAKADAMVSAAEVSGKVSTETTATDAKIIDANATIIANVQLSQRKDIGRSRRLALSLMEELEAETGNIELFHELGELLRSADDKGQDKRNDLYQKVISSAGRIDSMKKLAETMRVLISLEREAFGIDEKSKDKGGEPTTYNMSF